MKLFSKEEKNYLSTKKEMLVNKWFHELVQGNTILIQSEEKFKPYAIKLTKFRKCYKNLCDAACYKVYI